MALAGCQSAEEQAAEFYEEALGLVDEGDIDRALVQLRNAFQSDQNHLESRELFARLQLERGEMRGAYSQYLRIAEQFPEHLESRVQLARIAFVARDWEEFDRHASRAVELAPDDADVRELSIAIAYRDAVIDSDAPARRDVGREAAALLDERTDSRILRSVVIDELLREQDLEGALAQLDQMIAQFPEEMQYRQQRLQIMAEFGDMDGVREELRRLVELFPEEVTFKQNLIRLMMSEGDVDSTEAFLRELAEAAPEGELGPWVDLVRFQSEVRGPEAALEELDAIIERVGEEDRLVFSALRASILFDTGQRETAIAEMERILDGAENTPEVLQYRAAYAQMLESANNVVGARTVVEEILEADPAQAEALKMQARWLIAEDATDAAIASLRTALDRNPDDADAMTLMAQAYVRTGQQNLARDFLSLAVDASGNAPDESLRYARLLMSEERYEPAEDILMNAVRLAPANVPLLTALGQLTIAIEDFGRARQVVDALRQVGTEEANLAADGIEAQRLSAESGPEDAIAFLEQLASNSDSSVAARVALIRARLSTGENEAALSLADELVESAPDNLRYKLIRASVQNALGQLEMAETELREVLDAEPQIPAVWLELIRLKERMGEPEAARSVLAEGLEILPENPQLLWADASYKERDGEIDAAIEIYEALYAQDSNNVVVANNLASLLATYKDDEESLERAWTIARRLNEAELPPLQDTYGWILHRRGESEAALPYLESAAAGLPGDPIVQYHLAEVYAATDRLQEAVDQYRSAVEIAGELDTRPQIARARERVRELTEQTEADEPRETE